jgi:ribosomal protein S18 acetylase RimI-like enzyme
VTTWASRLSTEWQAQLTDTVIDNPVWASLTTTHAHLATISGGAARFPADVAWFVGLENDGAWPDLAKITEPGERLIVVGTANVPDDWTVAITVPGVQLVATPAVRGAEYAEAVRLTAADVPDMLDLVARTEPGPFRPRTIELGTYLGIRRDGRLIAMAGERLRPPGWTELSAVCTDPAFQGRGLASRLIGAIVAGIHARGEIPFLHTGADNTTAIRLYERLGFEIRRPTTFTVVHPPK